MVTVWLVVLVVAVVIEAITVQMVAIWFAPAALVAMLLSVFGLPLWLQVSVFVAVAAAFVALLYKKLCKSISDNCEKTNLDAIIGADAVAEADFDGVHGRVKVRGMSWQAVCNESVKAGDTVNVEAIDGVTLKCKVKETANII